MFIDLATVLAFVDRTVARGVPTRIALTRAARRYKLDRDLLVAAHRWRTNDEFVEHMQTVPVRSYP